MSHGFNVIVAGSRDFDDYNLLSSTLDKLFYVKCPNAIVCGEAKGADSLGKQYAIERHIRVFSFPANWRRYGRNAGFIRNTEMLEHADCLVAFWDGKSKGTKHMIDISRKAGIEVHIVRFDKGEKT